MKYYKRNSIPLVEVTEEHIKAGDIVYNELGKCVKKVYVDENVYFVEVVESVLNEGETVSGLSKTQLSLFWTLSKNELKEHEDKNKNSRRRLLY